jgi:hypothetical protein
MAVIQIICASCIVLAGFGDEPFSPGRSRLGINLSGPADWNTEQPFVDVFRLARAWISQEQGKGWGRGPALELDARGWVKSLAPGCSAETLMCTIEGGHYPAGRYVCLYEGEGAIEFSNAGRVVSRAPGRIVCEVAPERGAIFLRLAATNPENPVRAIRVLMPGFEERYRREPFHPDLLARWKHMRVLRFMDWMQTNGSTIAEWTDRPVPEDATWTVKGIPLEVMIDLANRLGADAWFCMPHRATDSYVRAFAAQVKRELAPERKVYIEYSNEIWNAGFEQTRYAGEMGRKLGFHEKDWEAGWRYGAYRSVEIFKIWEEAFGGRERLVRVMASQAANAYVSDVKLAFRDAYKNCDALGIAPYVSLNVSATSVPNAATVAAWSPAQVLDHMEGTSLPQAIEWIRASKKTADRYGVALIAYEAGQHAVGVGGGENVEALTRVLTAANRHDRMGALYTRYLDAWRDEGGGLCAVFASVGAWSKWGSWGLLEHCDDDTPKFRAVAEWNLANPIGFLLEEFDGASPCGVWERQQPFGEEFAYEATPAGLVMRTGALGRNQHLVRRGLLIDHGKPYTVECAFTIKGPLRPGVNSFCLNLNVAGPSGDVSPVDAWAVNVDLRRGAPTIMKYMGFARGAFRQLGERACSWGAPDTEYDFQVRVNQDLEGRHVPKLLAVTVKEGAAVRERFQQSYAAFPYQPDPERQVRFGVNTHGADWTMRRLRIYYGALRPW